MRSLAAFTLAVSPFVTLPAQSRVAWRVLGDTMRAPTACSASSAVSAIDTWFTAFNNADSAGLAVALASRFVVSTGKHWITGDAHRRFDDTLSTLFGYVRQRHTVNERLSLDSVRFHGWRGARLGFMPYYKRSAADLGRAAIAGWGKAEFWCRAGIRVLNLAPVRQALPRPPSNGEL